LWATDVLIPANSYYIIEAYTSTGRLAWNAPQYLNLPTGGSYNFNNFVPNQPPPQPVAQNITLQTNGVNNSVQTLENLQQGTNITLVNSSGTTTINATGSSGFSVSGSFFFGPGLLQPKMYTNSSTESSTITNIGQAFKFELLASITVDRAAVYVTAAQAAHSIAFGIYDSSGNLLLDAGNMSVAATGQVTTTFSPTSFTVGTLYWFAAIGTSGTNITVAGIAAVGNLTTTGAGLFQLATNGYVDIGNTYNGTNMPATLGTLTAVSTHLQGTPLPVFYKS
jgi:hypothetical protein